MTTCARLECEVEYTKNVHNQIYCSPECCRVATNNRLKQKLQSKRDRAKGRPVRCRICNETVLSQYNSDDVCGKCEAAANSQKTQRLRSLFQ